MIPICPFDEGLQLSTLSESWRITGSSYKPLELANSLKSLKLLAGQMATKDVDIRYNVDNQSITIKEASGHLKIRINPEPALRSNVYPIPAANFDILAGYTIHEASHIEAKSNHILETIQKMVEREDAMAQISAPIRQNTRGKAPQLSRWSPDQAHEFGTILTFIATIGEELYCDRRIYYQYPKLGQYILRSRYDDWLIAKDSIPTIETSPYGIWAFFCLYGHLLPNNLLDTDQQEVLSKLLSLTRYIDAWLVNRNNAVPIPPLLTSNPTLPNKNPVLPAQRAAIYELVARAIAEDMFQEAKDIAPGIPANVAIGLDGGNYSKYGGQSADKSEPQTETITEAEVTPDPSQPEEPKDDSSIPLPDLDASIPMPLHNASQTISEDLDKLLSQALDDQIQDLTQEYNKLKKDKLDKNPMTYYGSEYASGSIISKPADGPSIAITPPSGQFAKKLWFLNQYKTKLGKTIYRSLPPGQGNLDQTRLHKGTYTNQIFKQKRTTKPTDLDLVLLLDASGSMRDHLELYPIAYSIKHMLPKTTIISYQADNATTLLNTHTYLPPNITGILPNGGTPSGPAILMALYKHPTSLVIHFSDGEATQGISIAEALEIAETEFPKAFIVSIEYPRQRTPDHNRANSSIVSLEDIGLFPEALELALAKYAPSLGAILTTSQANKRPRTKATIRGIT